MDGTGIEHRAQSCYNPKKMGDLLFLPCRADMGGYNGGDKGDDYAEI
jgi:hypothetical protein